MKFEAEESCLTVFNIDTSADAESYPTLMPIPEGTESKNGLIKRHYFELYLKTAELEKRVSALEAAISGALVQQTGRGQAKTEAAATPRVARPEPTERKDPEPIKQKPRTETGSTAARYRKLYPGEAVSLGCYKNEPVEWIVLRSDSSSTLLLSKYMLDHRPYLLNAETLSAWLNRVFFTNIFSGEELSLLRPAKTDETVSTQANVGEGHPLLFLLSVEDYNRYSKTVGVGDFVQTAYDRELYCFDKTANPSTWWLRSDNTYSGSAPCVSKDNGIIYAGMLSYYKRGVRPAVFTDTAALIGLLDERTDK